MTDGTRTTCQRHMKWGQGVKTKQCTELVTRRQWTQWSLRSGYSQNRKYKCQLVPKHTQKHVCPSDISSTFSVNPGRFLTTGLLFPAGRFPLFFIKFMRGITEFHLWPRDTGWNYIELKTFTLWSKRANQLSLVKSTHSTGGRAPDSLSLHKAIYRFVGIWRNPQGFLQRGPVLLHPQREISVSLIHCSNTFFYLCRMGMPLFTKAISQLYQ